MKKPKLGQAALTALAAFIVAGSMAGCDGDSSTSGSTQTTSSSSGSDAGGAGGAGGEGGGGGAGGAGGATAIDNGAPATEMVSAGAVSESKSYMMVHTLGQPTQNQGKSTSSSYRLQGGLNGANGSLP